MNRKIYEEVAKKYDVSAEEVKKEMQAAISEAFKNPTAEALNIPRKGGVPTIDEFFAYAVRKIEKT